MPRKVFTHSKNSWLELKCCSLGRFHRSSDKGDSRKSRSEKGDGSKNGLIRLARMAISFVVLTSTDETDPQPSFLIERRKRFRIIKNPVEFGISLDIRAQKDR